MSFINDYNIIVNSLSNGDWIAVNNNGQFEKVSALGSAWRWVSGTGFDDCKLDKVAEAIVKFAKDHKNELGNERLKQLRTSLSTLHGRLDKQSAGFNASSDEEVIQSQAISVQINNLDKLIESPEELEKQLEIAKKQQLEEKPEGFNLEGVEAYSEDAICQGYMETAKKQNVPVSRFKVNLKKGMEGSHACEAHVQGRRVNMEDSSCINLLRFRHQGKKVQAQLYGIFDGHGGIGQFENTSDYCAKELGDRIEQNLEGVKNLSDETITESLINAFVSLNKECNDLVRQEKIEGGTTATCALKINEFVYISNVGDSRTILVNPKNQTTTQLSEDINPLDKDTNKVGLAIADHEEDSYATPKITKINAKEEEGSYVVLACDGLWDVASTNEVGDVIRKMDEQGLDLSIMADSLAKAAVLRGSNDNVSVMIIKLQSFLLIM